MGCLGDSALQTFSNPAFVIVNIYIYINILGVFLLYDSFSLLDACIFVEIVISIYHFSCILVLSCHIRLNDSSAHFIAGFSKKSQQQGLRVLHYMVENTERKSKP